MDNKLNIHSITKSLRDELPYLESHFQVASIDLFGSYARNEQTSKSDLDLLVTFKKTPGFIRFMKLENYLSDKLGVTIDLVMKDALKKNIGAHIKKEAIPV